MTCDANISIQVHQVCVWGGGGAPLACLATSCNFLYGLQKTIIGCRFNMVEAWFVPVRKSTHKFYSENNEQMMLPCQ